MRFHRGLRRSFWWFYAPLILAGFPWGIALPVSAATDTPWVAKWIWHPGADVHGYNQTIVARKEFRLGEPRRARLRVTADSFYRVLVNGRWVNDGPARNWPEHYQYDELDVTSCLHKGNNEIRIIGRYYGVGDFHRVPQQAGLLAQLDVELANGRTFTLGTDGSWKTSVAEAWTPGTPKASIQMEPAELYDARKEPLEFRRAAVLFDATAGPWKDLSPRDVALMSRQPVAFKSFLGARVVRADGADFCLPAARLANPGVIEANHTVSCAGGMAMILELNQERLVRFESDGMKMAIDGQRNERSEFRLGPGRHMVLAFVRDICGHQKEKALRLVEPANVRVNHVLPDKASAAPGPWTRLSLPGAKFENPLDASHENPWCYLRFPEYTFVTNDLRWIHFQDEDPRVAQAKRGYARETDELLSSIKDEAAFREKFTLTGRAEALGYADMFVEDTAWQFYHRQVVGEGAALVRDPAALMHNHAGVTTVWPSPDGDVELLYDLGEQNCGYYDLELVAEAGVKVDVYGIEYIAPDGRLQHTWGNRNGMRCVTKEGVNRFLSLKRRSGRYVFLTLRGFREPIAIHRFQLIESTYPVNYVGSFSCSDARLDRIWEISTRTLKLCMEDTFTDCPLYEQTHWVGDARNESLLAYGVFGAEDLARRCIRLTAESLDRYPIAGCQTPSCWDTILPAWSFLWGISTWDYYWQTGERGWLRQAYPHVIRNLQGAERYVGDRDLFSGPFWNMFDWTGADQSPKTVLHNSMFLVGAIDAALREADVLGDSTHVQWLRKLRARLVGGINRLWDPARKSYPDSVRDDGSISPSTCQHTSFLSVLYDIVEPGNAAAAKANLLEPPEKMVRIGSPFAVLYLYETYEKLGLEDQIIREIYQNYLPMVESGATTVWESFPSGTTGSGGFPTRSHCHAWSSAPSRFLNRIILGMKTTSPGGRTVTISPRLNGLTWARGATATFAGPVHVSWKREGEVLDVTFSAPSGVQAEFVRNDTHAGLKVRVNARDLP